MPEKPSYIPEDIALAGQEVVARREAATFGEAEARRLDTVLELHLQHRADEWLRSQEKIVLAANRRAEERADELRTLFGLEDYVALGASEVNHQSHLTLTELGAVVEQSHALRFANPEHVVDPEAEALEIFEGWPMLTILSNEESPNEVGIVFTAGIPEESKNYDSRLIGKGHFEDEMFVADGLTVAMFGPRTANGERADSDAVMVFDADGEMIDGYLTNERGEKLEGSDVRHNRIYEIVTREGFKGDKRLDLTATIQATAARFEADGNRFVDFVWKDEPESAGNPEPEFS